MFSSEIKNLYNLIYTIYISTAIYININKGTWLFSNVVDLITPACANTVQKLNAVVFDNFMTWTMCSCVCVCCSIRVCIVTFCSFRLCSFWTLGHKDFLLYSVCRRRCCRRHHRCCWYCHLLRKVCARSEGAASLLLQICHRFFFCFGARKIKYSHRILYEKIYRER